MCRGIQLKKAKANPQGKIETTLQISQKWDVKSHALLQKWLRDQNCVQGQKHQL